MAAYETFRSSSFDQMQPEYYHRRCLGSESWDLFVFLSQIQEKSNLSSFSEDAQKISFSPSGISATIYMNTGLPMRQVLKEISGIYWGILTELQTWLKATHTREEFAL